MSCADTDLAAAHPCPRPGELDHQQHYNLFGPPVITMVNIPKICATHFSDLLRAFKFGADRVDMFTSPSFISYPVMLLGRDRGVLYEEPHLSQCVRRDGKYDGVTDLDKKL